MKKLVAFIAASFACMLAYAGYSFYYVPPPNSGIVWIIVDPAVVDYKNYQALIRVDWGSYHKDLPKFYKSGAGQIVIGMVKADTSAYPMTVTSKSVTLFGSNKANIENVYLGDRPYIPYATYYVCGQNLAC